MKERGLKVYLKRSEKYFYNKIRTGRCAILILSNARNGPLDPGSSGYSWTGLQSDERGRVKTGM